MEKEQTGKTVYIAHDADIIGDVRLGEGVNVWYHAVLRTEGEPVTIGEGTNVQDGCVFHTDRGFPVETGKNVTVGHGAILHGCTVGDNTIVGMGSIVLNGAKIGKNCVIGAGTLVPGGKEIPDGHLAFGNPMQIKRPLSEKEIAELPLSAAHYRHLAEKLLPKG